MRAATILIATLLACPSWGAEAVNPPRPGPTSEGKIGISIVVPPRDQAPVDEEPAAPAQPSES
jgi:hypothetical protein